MSVRELKEELQAGGVNMTGMLEKADLTAAVKTLRATALESGRGLGRQTQGTSLGKGGPSEDTLQRVLPLVLERLQSGGVAQFEILYRTSKSRKLQLEARGFCNKTVQVCSALAKGGDTTRLRNALRRVNPSTGKAMWNPVFGAKRAWDIDEFLQRSAGWKGSLQEWLQAASQEPDGSFLSRGAASTAQLLGVPLVQWRVKPQEKYPGLYTAGICMGGAVGFSRDGTRVASGAKDLRVKVWEPKTGAEVNLTP